MIKHIVMWTLNEPESGQTKAAVAAEIKKRLEALNGRMAGMKHLEVGIALPGREGGADVALYSEFEDEAALKRYIEHPEHAAAAKFVGSARKTRIVADYEA